MYFLYSNNETKNATDEVEMEMQQPQYIAKILFHYHVSCFIISILVKEIDLET